MALRAAASTQVVAPTRVTRSLVVRPQAAMKAQQKAGMAAIAAGVAMVAAAAPAEAANVINTVASAAEGYPFVPPEWAPAVFTPLVGLVLPAIAMATLFVYIEKEAPQQ